jgi:hypothetical protein
MTEEASYFMNSNRRGLANIEVFAQNGNGPSVFHIVVEDLGRTYTVDGPGGPSGLHLHFEMLQASRALKGRYRDFDVRFNSGEEVRSYMLKYFPGYTFSGSWACSRAESFLSRRGLHPRIVSARRERGS